jgi:hypothetical protein
MLKDVGCQGLGSHADERSRSRAARNAGSRRAEQDGRGERGESAATAEKTYTKTLLS